MVSFKTTLLALAGAATVSADYWINVTAVPLADRQVWCRDQKAACPLICAELASGPLVDNSCTPETLTYGCICSDHTQPNLSEYSMTIPFHLCQQWGNNCVKDCGAWDNECSNKCREENLCGAQDPKKPNTSTTATSEPTATPSSDPDQVFNGISGATDGATNNGNSGSGAAALHFGQAYGLVVVLTSLFAGFAIML